MTRDEKSPNHKVQQNFTI